MNGFCVAILGLLLPSLALAQSAPPERTSGHVWAGRTWVDAADKEGGVDDPGAGAVTLGLSFEYATPHWTLGVIAEAGGSDRASGLGVGLLAGREWRLPDGKLITFAEVGLSWIGGFDDRPYEDCVAGDCAVRLPYAGLRLLWGFDPGLERRWLIAPWVAAAVDLDHEVASFTLRHQLTHDETTETWTLGGWRVSAGVRVGYESPPAADGNVWLQGAGVVALAVVALMLITGASI